MSECVRPQRFPVVFQFILVVTFSFLGNPLYACKNFKAIPYEQMVTILKQNGFCLNCFKPTSIWSNALSFIGVKIAKGSSETSLRSHESVWCSRSNCVFHLLNVVMVTFLLVELAQAVLSAVRFRHDIARCYTFYSYTTGAVHVYVWAWLVRLHVHTHMRWPDIVSVMELEHLL